jgi:hypothetical protein
MRTIRRIDEAEMVSVFLKTEIESARFGREILEVLERLGLDRRLVDSPDLRDEAENLRRAEVLGEFRGYGRDEGLFVNFPRGARWERALVGRAELEKVKYIHWDYWLELSGGSRLALDGARNVAAGALSEARAAGYFALADALRRGVPLPELILVGTAEGGGLVVLEGHVRLTSYLLRPENLPPELPAIVGYSEDFARWELF